MLSRHGQLQTQRSEVVSHQAIDERLDEMLELREGRDGVSGQAETE
jgi:hypothetical protein